jgi:RimJ/RimL family protein N-acetyltransferase
MFLNIGLVCFDEHKEWFELSLLNSHRTIYIAEIDFIKIGVCRFDANKKLNTSEVSINLNPKIRGKNLAYDFLHESIEIYKKTNNVTLTAAIKNTNVASLKIFKKCGFIESNRNDDFTYLKLS